MTPESENERLRAALAAAEAKIAELRDECDGLNCPTTVAAEARESALREALEVVGGIVLGERNSEPLAASGATPTCATCGGTGELGTKDRGYGEEPLPCPDCGGKERR